MVAQFSFFKLCLIIFSTLLVPSSLWAQNNCQTDRISSLLSSPDRIGFGANTTGGAAARQFTVVSNTNSSGPGSLRDAIQKSETDSRRAEPVWVIFDESLRGRTIVLDRAISTFQSNLTIDGRGQNGILDITISPSSSAGNIAMIQLRGGNTILHGITLDGRGQVSTALMPRQGHNYWLDHLTITGFKSDDAISIGQGSKADSASEVTISNYLAYDTSKAIQSGGNENFPNFPLHRGTILKSSLGAFERNPRIAFGGRWHMFNNHVHSFGIGSGIDINNAAQMIAENNVVSGEGARAPQRAITGRRGNGTLANGQSLPIGHVYTRGNQLINNAGEEGSINPSSPRAFTIPYNYQTMPVGQVVNYVRDNAGARNASGSLLVCDSTTANTPVTPAATPTTQTPIIDNNVASNDLAQANILTPSSESSINNGVLTITFDTANQDVDWARVRVGNSTYLSNSRGVHVSNKQYFEINGLRRDDPSFNDPITVEGIPADGSLVYVSVFLFKEGKTSSVITQSYNTRRDSSSTEGTTEPQPQATVPQRTTSATASKNSSGVCSTKHSSLIHARQTFNSKCGSYNKAEGHDCDRVAHLWVCANQSVESIPNPLNISSEPATRPTAEPVITTTSLPISTTTTTTVELGTSSSPEPTVELPSDNSEQERKRTLLESPWKFGFGAATTGAGYGGRIYVVTNTNDSGPGSLRQGLSQSGNWVIYDSRLDGRTIFLESSIHIARNITWDGRDALVRIAPARNARRLTFLRFTQGNAIVHRVLWGPTENLSGFQNTNHYTGVSVTQGENYWFDHVESSNHDDDSFGIGNHSRTSAINITVTHYKVYNADKGLLVFQDSQIQQNAGRVGQVTIAYSDFAAICRNFRVSGGRYVHGFNNYVHDFGGDTCGNVAGHGKASNRDGRGVPVLLAESSVYEDQNDGLAGLFDQVQTPSPFDSQGYVFTDGENIFLRGSPNNFVFRPGDRVTGGVERPSPPYSYPKMDARRVKEYVERNAGVNGANIPFLP